MLDLKIINGAVIDGTGGPRITADVGVRAGKIVAVGSIVEDARETLDASGLIVAPGFIDCHTHYDAQVFWDPRLSPSCFHGVTTVVGGFCGFSIAPMTPAAAEYIRPMLARVEGMPLTTLEAAVPWNSWSSFGEFLAKLEGKVGLNVGFFCGHSTLRCIAMGKRAVGNRATAPEIDHMKSLLAAAIKDGALGFSTTISPSHNDADGNPVPSRWADYSELLELARIVRDFPGTGLELLPDLEFAPEVVELMANFSIAGNRPVNWNALAVTGDDLRETEERVYKMLEVSNFARERGGEVIALTIPSSPRIFQNLSNGVGFDSMPGIWREIFKTPISERIEAFKNQDVRQQLARDAASMPVHSPLRFKTAFDDYLVVSVVSDGNKRFEGRYLRDIAKELESSALEAMLDIAVSDWLQTTFTPNTGGESRASYVLRGKLWQDDRTLIGASDAGAHLDAIDTFAFSTLLLQWGVREHGVISLEEAVHCITDRIARYFGLINRGRIVTGYNADMVVFDERKVGRSATYIRQDVPGNAGRIYADAKGIPHVFVNGVQIVRDGEHTRLMPGAVLRSGKDTRTVAMKELRR